MDGPIITVDVSKGNCHYQPFLEKGKPLRKPKILYDTIEGFEELEKSVRKNGILTKVMLVLLVIFIVFSIILITNYVFNLGLF